MLSPANIVRILLHAQDNSGGGQDEGQMGDGPTRPQHPIRYLVRAQRSLQLVLKQLIDRYLNVYYRRTHRLDAPLITAIRMIAEPPPESLESELQGWVKASGDLHSGVWPSQKEARIWYKLQDRDTSGRRQEASTDFDDVITELDILYGDDEPFFGFERIDGGQVLKAEAGKWESVDITYRRGNPCTLIWR